MPLTTPKPKSRKRTTPKPKSRKRTTPKPSKYMNKGLWEVVKDPSGRPPKYNAPKTLWTVAKKYFVWCRSNPLWEARIVSDKGSPVIEHLPKMRAMTLSGFFVFSGLTQTQWGYYLREKGPEWSVVCQQITECIRDQKFSGATAGLMNVAIIMRDLGMAEKQEISGVNGQPLCTSNNPVVILPAKVRTDE